MNRVLFSEFAFAVIAVLGFVFGFVLSMKEILVSSLCIALVLWIFWLALKGRGPKAIILIVPFLWAFFYTVPLVVASFLRLLIWASPNVG